MLIKYFTHFWSYPQLNTPQRNKRKKVSWGPAEAGSPLCYDRRGRQIWVKITVPRKLKFSRNKGSINFFVEF